MSQERSVSTSVLIPMSREKAVALTNRLLGCYPSLSLHDPKTFSAQMVETFLKFPAWVGEQALTEATRASPQFVPSVPSVELACEAVVKQTRDAMDFASQWEHRTQRQLEERRQVDSENSTESLEYRREVVRRLWPQALIDPGKRLDLPPKSAEPFRQFTKADLESIYRRHEGASQDAAE